MLLFMGVRRSDSLSTRIRQANTIAGIGLPRSVERVEKRMVPKDEGNHIATTGVTSLTDDWDKAWGSDEEEVPSSNKGRHRDSINEERQASQLGANNTASHIVDTGDDVLDAWNWGDEDDTAEDTLVSSPQLSFSALCPFWYYLNSQSWAIRLFQKAALIWKLYILKL